MNAARRSVPQKEPSRAWMRALETTARATRDPARTLPRAIAEWAERYGDRPALIGDDETYSFTGLRRASTNMRAGVWRKSIAKGATVALMMRNRPEYAAIWLGLTRIGVVVALISPDLHGPALAHALAVAPRLAVASPEARRQSRGAGSRARSGLAARASDRLTRRSSSIPARRWRTAMRRS